VTVAGMTNSTLFAGVKPGTTALPTNVSELTPGNSIKSFNDTGKSVFANSDIAAYTLNSVNLRNATLTNHGTPFGTAAHAYGAFSLLQPKAKPVHLSGKKRTATCTTSRGDIRV